MGEELAGDQLDNLKRPRGLTQERSQDFSEGGSQEPQQQRRGGVCETVRRARAHASSAI